MNNSQHMIKNLFLIGLVVIAIIWTVQLAAAQNFSGRAGADEQVSQEALKNAPAAAPVTEVITETKDEILPPEVVNFVTGLNIEGSSTYTLGPTDVVEITVQRHPEVTGQFPINKEGKIQYQFVGDVFIANLTKDQLKEVITQRLSEYIINPEVSVKIIGYNSKVVYVIGEVGSPGKIFMQGDTITVREALVQAGLPLLSASTRKCPLITPSADGHPKKLVVNIFSLLYEGDLRENLVMKPGDTLYIPATILSKAMRVIQPVAQPIGTTADTGKTVMTGF